MIRLNAELKSVAFELIGLQTPRARLFMFALGTFMIFLVPYNWLANLSLWKRIGWDWAPSIGLTRAYWLVLHGDFAGAWGRNAWIYLVLLVLFILLFKDIVTIRRRKPVSN